MNISEIREKVSSQELDILKQSLTFINEKISNERVRASRAETRAVATLAFSGAFSSIVIVQLPNIVTNFIHINWDSFNWLLVLVLYVATILSLLKSSLFAFQALGDLKKNELTPYLIFEIQDKNHNDALREEIIYKIWEYYQLLPVNSTRLFWVSHAQRNILGAIIFFITLGISLVLLKILTYSLPNWVILFISILIIIYLISVDIIVDKINKFWH